MVEGPNIEQNSSLPEISKKKYSCLERIKDITSIIQSIFIVGGIIIGAIWFFMQAEPIPRANISHDVTHRQIDKNWTWVMVSINISNPGKRPLILKSGTFRLQGILPLDAKISDKIKREQNPMELVLPDFREVNWPQIGNKYEEVPLNFKLNPGENEKLIVEFFIPSSMRTIQVYSHFKDTTEMGWTETSIYDTKNKEKNE